MSQYQLLFLLGEVCVVPVESPLTRGGQGVGLALSLTDWWDHPVTL